MDHRAEQGLKFFGEVMGEDRAKSLEQVVRAGGFGAAVGEMALDFVFGSVWNRDGLDRGQRSLVVIGILIAQRQTAELTNHIRIGVANGLSPQQLEETLVQAVPYVGFPAAASAMTAMADAFHELGIELRNQGSGERR